MGELSKICSSFAIAQCITMMFIELLFHMFSYMCMNSYQPILTTNTRVLNGHKSLILLNDPMHRSL